jgi:anti-anti-sigma factor
MAPAPDDLLRLDVVRRPAAQSVTVSARGEVDISTSPWLRAAVTRLITTGSSVIVDFDEVTFMDASGVGALVAAHNLAEGAGETFTVRRPNEMVARVPEITGLCWLVSERQSATGE